MNKPTMAIIFLLSGGALTGGISSVVNKPAELEFPDIQTNVGNKLNQLSSKKFEILKNEHFEFIHIIPKWKSIDKDGQTFYAMGTHAKYKVPSVMENIKFFYENEHWSYTNENSYNTIINLGRTVIIPFAKNKCPILNNSEIFPELEDGHIMWMGIEKGKNAVAQLVVHPKAEMAGFPAENCIINEPAPQEIIDQVNTLLNTFMKTAICDETGLRCSE